MLKKAKLTNITEAVLLLHVDEQKSDSRQANGFLVHLPSEPFAIHGNLVKPLLYRTYQFVGRGSVAFRTSGSQSREPEYVTYFCRFEAFGNFVPAV